VEQPDALADKGVGPLDPKQLPARCEKIAHVVRLPETCVQRARQKLSKSIRRALPATHSCLSLRGGKTRVGDTSDNDARTVRARN